MKRGILLESNETPNKTVKISIIDSIKNNVLFSKDVDASDAYKMTREYIEKTSQVEIIDKINNCIYHMNANTLKTVAHPQTGQIILILPQIKKDHILFGIIFKDDGTTELHQKKKKQKDPI